MKKTFTLMIVIVFIFVLSGCKEKTIKTETDIFIEEFTKKYPRGYKLDDSWYKFHSIETKTNYVGDLETTIITKFEGFLNFKEEYKFSATSNKYFFKSDTISYQQKQINKFIRTEKRLNNKQYYLYNEENILNENKNEIKTFGHNNIEYTNISFMFSWEALFFKDIQSMMNSEYNHKNYKIFVKDNCVYISFIKHNTGLTNKLGMDTKIEYEICFDSDYNLYSISEHKINIYKNDNYLGSDLFETISYKKLEKSEKKDFIILEYDQEIAPNDDDVLYITL